MKYPVLKTGAKPTDAQQPLPVPAFGLRDKPNADALLAAATRCFQSHTGHKENARMEKMTGLQQQPAKGRKPFGISISSTLLDMIFNAIWPFGEVP